MRGRYREVTLSVEDFHWWYRGRRRIVGQVLASLRLPAPARLLDVGCGGGGNLAELGRFGEVTGLEPSAEALIAARARESARIVEGGIEAMPFSDSSFDVAAALDVIEHVEDEGAGLREMRRVVRPGGILIVTVPAYQRLWGPHDVVNEHRRRYVRRTLLAAMEPAGWQPVLTSYFNSLLLPFAAVHRLAQRRRLGARAPEVSDLERTPSWMDSVLELPLRAEARVIAARVRIPAGLSLLGVFRADD